MRYLATTVLLAVLLASGTAIAQNAPERVGTIPGYLTPLGYCQLSVTSGAAVALGSCSGGIPAGALVAYITPETAAVRWRDDGTAPTTTVGTPIAAGTLFAYAGWMGSIQFIAESTTAPVNVAFYK